MHEPFLRRWVTFCAVLVALMVLVGGLTRLTESGLSIVEWKLVSGVLPPMSEQAWQEEFSSYQHSPQFKQVNSDFTVSDFKRIYWLEYLHRVLGRVIGLVLILPFAYLALRQKLSHYAAIRMGFACLLVMAQGAVGWIMVASGLVDLPRVEPVKLALHLSLAFALFGWLLWIRWGAGNDLRPGARPIDALSVRAFFALVCVQIVFGALVAGLDAGLVYNTFPLMDGKLVPSGLYMLSPWWVNHLEHIPLVQFQHRAGAWLVAIGAIWLAVRLWNQSPPMQRMALKWILAAVFLQFSLGVITLLSVVDISLASLHQMGALLLFGTALRALWLYPRTSA